MLQEEARQTASILHQTPGWRWRRELCLTERSQQCQSGPTTKAWRRLPARHRHDACETPSEHLRGAVPKLERNACQRGNVGRMRGIVRGHVREALPELHGNGRRVRVAPPERDPHGSGQHCFKELGRQRQETCGQHWKHAGCCVRSEPVRVAPPDGIVWTCAGSTARKRHLAIEAGPSYRSCTASPQRRRGVTVPSLIETIREL